MRGYVPNLYLCKQVKNRKHVLLKLITIIFTSFFLLKPNFTSLFVLKQNTPK